MKSYFNIPIKLRLEAFRRNGKTKLGGGWHEPTYDKTKPYNHPDNKKAKWHWVPESTIDTGLLGLGSTRSSCHGTWAGEPFKIDGSSTELRWCEDLDGYFRNIKPAHEIISLRHTGWYLDDSYNETFHGIVCQLPGRNGEPIYLYGVNDPHNKNAGMIAWRKCEWSDNKESAARWADNMAEHYAESAREDNAKYQAEFQIGELKDRIKEIRTELRLLHVDLKKSSISGCVCDVIRGHILDLRRESHKAWKKISELTDNYWVAVEQ